MFAEDIVGCVSAVIPFVAGMAAAVNVLTGIGVFGASDAAYLTFLGAAAGTILAPNQLSRAFLLAAMPQVPAYLVLLSGLFGLSTPFVAILLTALAPAAAGAVVGWICNHVLALAASLVFGRRSR